MPLERIYLRICRNTWSLRNSQMVAREWMSLGRMDLSLCCFERSSRNSQMVARENGCPWGEWTCASAARNGHIEVLIWAHCNGCPCSGYCGKHIIKHNGTYMSHQQRKNSILERSHALWARSKGDLCKLPYGVFRNVFIGYL
jgi:hypothetical protein